MSKITKEDVQVIADQLGYQPTPEEIKEVIEMYPSEQEADPSGTWELVVEQCLSSIGVYKASAKQILVDKVIERIKEDVYSNDMTAIDGLLLMLSKKELKDYLAED